MPEPIRVRDDKTGAEYSTYGVDENGQPYEGLTLLDEPAVDERGELLPPKYDKADEQPATEQGATEVPPTVTAKKAAARVESPTTQKEA